MKKAGILITVFVLIASMMTACGCSGNVTTDPTTTSSTTQTTKATTSTTTVPPTTTTVPPTTTTGSGATDNTSKPTDGKGDEHGLRRRDRIMPMR